MQIDRLLGQFGLDTKRRQIASTLSGGERRRLEIARCLASKPALILLDEPFTGIDPVTIHSIQDIIADLCDSGISILLTDHRERETLAITHRNYIISHGKVIVSGDAETVLHDRNAMREYFGERFDGDSIIEGKAPSARRPSRVGRAGCRQNRQPRRCRAGPNRAARASDTRTIRTSSESPIDRSRRLK